jgi:hypothetical protein
LAFAITLSTQRGDARFNVSYPFRASRLCLVVRGVPWQSQMGFPANAKEPSVWVAYVFRDALAGEPTTVFRSNQRDHPQCHLYAPFVFSAGKYVRSISTLLKPQGNFL